MTLTNPTGSTHSSLIDKIPPALREQIDQALLSPDSPTYQAVFTQFDLAGQRVSFTAFYTYARNLRHRAMLAQRAANPRPLTSDDIAATFDLLNVHLQKLLLDANPNSLKVKRIADACRGILWAHLGLDTHAEKKQAAREATESKVFRDLFSELKAMRAAGYDKDLEEQRAREAEEAAEKEVDDYTASL